MRIAFIVLVALLVPVVYGATIHGTVYDFELKPARNAVVEINTVPKQVIVAKEAFYSLTVPAGSYTIDARLLSQKEVVAAVSENITVSQEGTYTLDLLTFPLIDELSPVDEVISVDTSLMQERGTSLYWILGAVVIAVICIAIYLVRKTRKQPLQVQLHPDLEQVLAFIKKEGTTTQLALRHQFPLSEAKISLMLTDLEAKGLIKKIKKGRGNVITLP